LVTIEFYECHIRGRGKHPIAPRKALGQFAAMKSDQQKSNHDNPKTNQSHSTMKAKFDSYWPTLLALGVCSTLTTTHAGFMVPYPDAGTPVSANQELFATGGDVTLTYAGQGTAALSSILFLVSPGSPYNSAANPIFANQTTPLGTTLDLGAFLAGTELEFGIHVTYYGYGVSDWYTGPSSRNADNTVHAYLVNDYPTTGLTYVGFEDTQHGYADYNYQDFQFTATGLTTAVPEPSAVWCMALLGLIGVVWQVRSRTQQRPRQTE